MIRLEGVSRSWGSFSLREISLRVKAGEYFVIVGPTGSGKTLLLETIAGIYRPDSGRIFLEGREVTDLPPERRRVGFVYQEHCLFPHLTVRENIAYGLRYQRKGRAEMRRRVDGLVELLKLHQIADRPSPEGLSGGERQKVALARALAVDPAVLLLDEPLAAMDYSSREQVMETLQEINRGLGVTVVHVTHQYSEAGALADRIGVMRGGRLLQTGTVHEVFWRPANRFVATLVGVKNQFPGRYVRADGALAEIEAGGLRLRTRGRDIPGEVLVCLRPEDVALRREGNGGVNAIPAVVTEVADLGLSVRVKVQAGDLPVVAVMGKQQAEQLALRPGERILMEAAPESLHLLPLDAEE